MNSEQRLVLQKLVNLPNKYVSGLCCWCRYALWSGSCDDAELECEHPLPVISDCDCHSWDVWQGGDCWGFRPRYKYNDIVDAMGLVIQGEYPDMGKCTTKVNLGVGEGVL